MILSTWKERTAAIRERGSIERRDWNPSKDSFHAKLYRYWLKTSTRGGRKQRYSERQENFCHYWRVVCIWAPLWFLMNPVLVGLAIFAALAVIGGIVTGIVLAFTTGNAWVLAQFALVIYIVFGLISWFIYVLRKHNELTLDEWGKIPRFVKYLAIPAMVLTSPVIALIYCFVQLHEKFNLYQRAGKAMAAFFKWTVSVHPNHRYLFWVRPIIVVPVTIVILSFWFTWALETVMWTGAAVAFIALVLSIIWIGDYLRRYLEVRHEESMREINKQREAYIKVHLDEYMDTFLHKVFALIDLDNSNDEVAYQKWLTEYRERFHREHRIEEDAWYQPSNHLYLLDLFGEYFYTYDLSPGTEILDLKFRLLRERSLKKTSKSRRSNKILTNALGFTSFMWSKIVVSKWKICPLVDVPD